MAVVFLHQSDKSDYLSWIASHPHGFCIEVRRGDLTPLLHRVGCVCLGVESVDWVPIPVHCFDDANDVKAWFYESDVFGLSDEYVLSLQKCGICEPQK